MFYRSQYFHLPNERANLGPDHAALIHRQPEEIWRMRPVFRLYYVSIIIYRRAESVSSLRRNESETNK